MRRGRAMAWPMIVRTAVLDELILRAIERDGVDTVLNLAAGLDTRPYRLPLPSSLRWVEADFPDVIAYKREQLTGERPVCAVEHVGIDLTDVGLWRVAGRLYPKARGEDFRGIPGFFLPRGAGQKAPWMTSRRVAPARGGGAGGWGRPAPGPAGPSLITITATDYAFGVPDTIP